MKTLPLVCSGGGAMAWQAWAGLASTKRPCRQSKSDPPWPGILPQRGEKEPKLPGPALPQPVTTGGICVGSTHRSVWTPTQRPCDRRTGEMGSDFAFVFHTHRPSSLALSTLGPKKWQRRQSLTNAQPSLMEGDVGWVAGRGPTLDRYTPRVPPEARGSQTKPAGQ